MFYIKVIQYYLYIKKYKNSEKVRYVFVKFILVKYFGQLCLLVYWTLMSDLTKVIGNRKKTDILIE